MSGKLNVQYHFSSTRFAAILPNITRFGCPFYRILRKVRTFLVAVLPWWQMNFYNKCAARVAFSSFPPVAAFAVVMTATYCPLRQSRELSYILELFWLVQMKVGARETYAINFWLFLQYTKQKDCVYHKIVEIVTNAGRLIRHNFYLNPCHFSF